MSELDVLLSTSSVGRLLMTGLDDVSFTSRVWAWQQAGLTARVVRGQKMTRFEGLMDEFAAAFQFPYYFGENWSAFQECLGDMDWLPAGKGIVVAVFSASVVLSEESDEDLRVLTESLASAADEFAKPITDGQWWDRPPIPFHVVLQGEIGTHSDLDRWRQVGAGLVPLPN